MPFEILSENRRKKVFSDRHYVNEFAGRHNVREMDTIEQMGLLAKGMVGKRLKYKELVG